MFKGILAAAAVAALGFGGVLATATVSSAAVNPLQPFYHNESSVTSYLGDHMVPYWNSYNAPVDAEAVGQGYVDAFQAFSVGANLVHLSVRTDAGLSLSDPGPGSGALDNLVLRDTNDLGWQTFKEIPTSYPGYVALQDVRTNQFVTDNGAGVQLTGAADVGGVFDGSVNQLWKFSNNNFNHYRGRHVNPNPNPTPTVTVSPGHHHHPGPTPTATVTVSPSTGGNNVLTATEVVSGDYVNDTSSNPHALANDTAGNNVTVANAGTSPASVVVTDSATLSGTVTTNILSDNTPGVCHYTVNGGPIAVGMTPSGAQTVNNGTSVLFKSADVKASNWNAATVSSSDSGCTDSLSTLEVSHESNVTAVNLDVVLTPTVTVTGTSTTIPVNPSSVTENYTG